MAEKFDFLEELKKGLLPDTSILKKIDSFVDALNKHLKKQKIVATCVPGGSVAKGTFLKDDYDVDLFVKFDFEKYKDKDISKFLENVLSNYKSLEKLHGSRDYFQVLVSDITYELVPVIDICDPKEALNVTDMSPMHVTWVKKNIREGMQDDIRLTKKFCKGIGVYGAESYISGFSGHVIDILILNYGSFLELLEKAALWKPKVIIDVEKHYKKNEVLFELNRSKTLGPLVVVDPVLQNRNASAALSLEKFDIFRKKAKEFMKNPSRDFFFREIVTPDSLNKKAGKNIVIAFGADPGKGKVDVLGSKLLKAFDHILVAFQKNDFLVKESGWEWDKKDSALFWFIIDPKPLEAVEEILGPPEKIKEHAAAFSKKYKDVFTERGKLHARIRRKYTKAEQLAENILKDKYVKQRTKDIELVH
ncbi:MAG: CCA tRNA nucleotidyltransferase [Nanoarchaeota archaeon]|nr:CCA tRNA nucleotidyltransferase [Nanoarchaeota archaeon]